MGNYSSSEPASVVTSPAEVAITIGVALLLAVGIIFLAVWWFVLPQPSVVVPTPEQLAPVIGIPIWPIQ